MHPVIPRILGFHRQECAGPDMQSDECLLDAPRLKPLQQRRREMQSCGGRRDCAFIRCIYRLIVGPVLLVGSPS